MDTLKEGLVGERRRKDKVNLRISLLTEDFSLEFELAITFRVNTPPSCLLVLPPGRKDCRTKPVLGDYQKQEHPWLSCRFSRLIITVLKKSKNLF